MKKQLKISSIIVLCLVICYGIGVLIHSSKPRSKGIPIIGYHHLVNDQDKEQYFKYNMWVMSVSSFEEQMRLLHEEGYQSATLEDVYLWKQGKKKFPLKTVVITFDDGFYSTTKLAQPILASYGFTGAVFVVGSQIDNHRTTYDPSIRQHASATDMEDQRVLQYYAHSFDLHHKQQGDFKINRLTKAQLEDDTEKEKKRVSIDFYAYPYGKYNDAIKSVLREHGTKLAFGYNENRKARYEDDSYALPRFNINAYTKLDVFLQMLESE